MNWHPSNKQICEEFSKGNFEFSYMFLAEDILWNIVGDKVLKGKDSVIDFCKNTAEYFKQVDTKFSTNNIIADDDCVAINGTAIFTNSDNKSTHVSSCDVYRFKNGLLTEITSYCIVTDKDRQN